jgi:hypothetical protein
VAGNKEAEELNEGINVRIYSPRTKKYEGGGGGARVADETKVQWEGPETNVQN